MTFESMKRSLAILAMATVVSLSAADDQADVYRQVVGLLTAKDYDRLFSIFERELGDDLEVAQRFSKKLKVGPRIAGGGGIVIEEREMRILEYIHMRFTGVSGVREALAKDDIVGPVELLYIYRLWSEEDPKWVGKQLAFQRLAIEEVGVDMEAKNERE